jgi:O-antigen/teichoic acid export membrane protein
MKTIRVHSYISRLFYDEGLTKKAYLNALTSALDYVSQLLVAFLITPWVVRGLGDYFYGVWQILNRMVGYLSPASGKPTLALMWTLANQQSSADYEKKRRYVGSTLAVWALFLPLMITAGGVLSWFAPKLLNAPVESYWPVRITAALLVATLASLTLSDLPQSVLRGENMGYKRMGVLAALTFFGGGLTWLVLQLGFGIIGVAAVALITKLLGGLIYLFVARNHTPWFGVIWPAKNEMFQFLRLSGWFLGWDVVMNLMVVSDVVVLGLLNSVESVTTYTLTKYAPETLISFVAIVVMGIIPGLGGIIGVGDHKKAVQVRGEIMALTWVILTTLGTSILLWNRTFLSLWVGSQRFAGALPDLLIVLVVTQFVLIRNDASIIDLTLRIQHKVILGGVSVVIALAASGILVGVFKLGIIGVSAGLLIGRSILSISYPILVGRHLYFKFTNQLKSIIRPALVMGIFYLLAYFVDQSISLSWTPGIHGWIAFFLSASSTAIVILLLSFFLGLTAPQRRKILERLRMVIVNA